MKSYGFELEMAGEIRSVNSLMERNLYFLMTNRRFGAIRMTRIVSSYYKGKI